MQGEEDEDDDVSPVVLPPTVPVVSVSGREHALWRGGGTNEDMGETIGRTPRRARATRRRAPFS